MVSSDKTRRGTAWGLAQPHVRSYAEKIMPRIKKLSIDFHVKRYGEVIYGPYHRNATQYNYPVFAVKVGDWQDTTKPTILITGGVHGYEEAGVEAALHFLETKARDYAQHYNILVYPCIAPVAYEMDTRTNLNDRDPNRGFKKDSLVPECRAFMDSVARLNRRFLLTLDLHEALPNDAEIMKAHAKRQGRPDHGQFDDVPHEFYLYEDCARQEDRLGPAIIAAVEKITPVCKWPDICGDKNSGGVIYPEAIVPGSEYAQGTMMDSFLRAAGYTPQAFTTETFADRLSLQQRIDVQMAVICTALDKALNCPASKPTYVP